MSPEKKKKKISKSGKLKKKILCSECDENFFSRVGG